MAKEGLGIEITELRLGLPGDNNGERLVCEWKKKRVFSETMTSSSLATEDENSVVSSGNILADKVEDDSSPAVKSQLVGWPPVCSYRRKKKNEEAPKAKAIGFVKVSMDGVPYLRKIDLGSSHGYNHLATVLEDLFGCLGLGLVLKKGENCEYVIIYEDKDIEIGCSLETLADVKRVMQETEDCEEIRCNRFWSTTRFIVRVMMIYR